MPVFRTLVCHEGATVVRPVATGPDGNEGRPVVAEGERQSAWSPTAWRINSIPSMSPASAKTTASGMRPAYATTLAQTCIDRRPPSLCALEEAGVLVSSQTRHRVKPSTWRIGVSQRFMAAHLSRSPGRFTHFRLGNACRVDARRGRRLVPHRGTAASWDPWTIMGVTVPRD